MPRGNLLAALGAAVISALLPTVARAQQSTVPVVGFLNGASPNSSNLGAFQKGLAETGFVVGQDVMLETRWAEGHYERLPGMVADLINRQVAVIATNGGLDPARAAQSATTTVPVVFIIG